MANETDEWPIYRLANYAGGGSLIQLCRSLLIAVGQRNEQLEQSDSDKWSRRGNWNRSHNHGANISNNLLASSDYQLGESRELEKIRSTPATLNAKAIASETANKDVKNNNQMEHGVKPKGEQTATISLMSPQATRPITASGCLDWSQLIESHENAANLAQVQAKGQQLRQLSSILQQSISPFLESATPNEWQSARDWHKTSSTLSSVWPTTTKTTTTTTMTRQSTELANGKNSRETSLPIEQVVVRRKRANNKVFAAPVRPTPAVHIAETTTPNIRRPGSADMADDRQLSPVGVARRDAAIRGGVGGVRRPKRRPSSSQSHDTSQLDHRRQRHPPARGETFEKSDIGPQDQTKSALHQVLGPSASDGPATNSKWSSAAKLRGKFGESLVHIFIVNQSNEDLLLLTLLLHLWPQLVSDTFASDKFKGLNCLHLAVAYGNEQLLAHLVDVCQLLKLNNLVDVPVTGSLFRLPELSGQVSGGRQKTDDASDQIGNKPATYWCDRMSHWPTANGHEHFILFDKIKVTSSSSTQNIIYLGHSPLAWSVSFNSRSMFELLAGKGGANQDLGDPWNGNGCLHQVVINNSTGWTRFLVKMGANQELKNSHQLTPLKLAAHLGRVRLFDELMELAAFEFWSYSMVRCCGYPLTSLDSILEKQSALAVILESSLSDNEQKSRLLSSVVIKKLLEEKWRVFARRQFYHELVVTLIHLLLLTLTISLREQSSSVAAPQNLWTFPSWTDLEYLLLKKRKLLIQFASEVATWLLSSWQLLQLVHEWRRYRSLSQQWIYNPLLVNTLVANALIWLRAPLRLVGYITAAAASGQTGGRWSQLEDIMLIFAAPLLWSSLLFFVAAFRVTGPFVAMIRYMIVRDLRQFSVIYLIFLYAFAQSIFFVNHETTTGASAGSAASSAETQTSGIREKLANLAAGYLNLWMELFKMTFGVYDLQPFRHSALARLYFVLFIYLIPILFNMLIAMMNNTYSLIISQSERAWSFQWARTLFALERRLTDEDKQQYLKMYAINMPAPKSLATGPTDPNAKATREQPAAQFVPALMIIKKMSYTRAERKRLVMGYWQKAVRTTIEAARGSRNQTDPQHQQVTF